MKIPSYLIAIVIGCQAAGCATTPTGSEHSTLLLRANHVITVTDDFAVDVYLNGVRVPDNKRKLLAEIFGATVERMDLKVYHGDWLVFHVVNDRLRWGGSCYFASAGVLQHNEFGFVSETESGDWSACDDPAKAGRFIKSKWYLARHHAQPISQVWQDGTAQMKKFAGNSWAGEPLWGLTPDTWLKVIVK